MRYYWRRFLEAHRDDLRGTALEIGSGDTLAAFGNARVVKADVLDLGPRPGVTAVADLSRADHLADDSYDCFVVPFTTHLIFDIEAALYHAIRVLKPGGVLLVNFPCLDYDFSNGLDMGTGRTLFVFWSFTPLQVQNLLRRAALRDQDFEMRVDGNLFARVAYQMNLPAEELTPAELAHADPGHPLIVSVRVVKPEAWQGQRPEYRDAWTPSTTPARWNRQTGHYPRA